MVDRRARPTLDEITPIPKEWQLQQAGHAIRGFILWSADLLIPLFFIRFEDGSC